MPRAINQSLIAHRGAVQADDRRRFGRRIPAPASQTDAGSSSAPPALFSLRLRGLLNFFRQQPTSYKLVCFYLFMEYVRPQQIYTAIAGPPYSKFIIAFAIVAFFVEGKKFRMGLPEVVLGIFTAIVVASSVFAVFPDASSDQISVYLSWVLIYLLIANTADTEERFLFFALTFIVWSYKMAQFGARSWVTDGFHFRAWGINGAPGWFSNSGEFAIQMVVLVGCAIYFMRGLSRYWTRWMKYLFWTVPVFAVIGAVGSSSRGALVGLAVMALWMLLKTRHKVRALVGTAILAMGVYWLLPAEQMIRLQTMGDDGTSISRTTLWKHGLEIMGQYPLLGIGYKNWSRYNDLHYRLAPAAAQHFHRGRLGTWLRRTQRRSSR